MKLMNIFPLPSGAVNAVLLFISLSGPSIAQEILHDPENTTVFLDQSAVFSCEVNGGLSGWRINGTLLEDLSPEIHSDLELSTTNNAEGYTLLNLTITARAEYNGTRVQCLVARFGGSSSVSENATLKIQGPLSAVVNLRASSDTSSVTIWWTAPFSLDVTGVDPDIWYSVLIYNVTDEDNPTAILCIDCTNITETHYTFTPDYLSPCHVYTFSVTPFNGAGQGQGESSPIVSYSLPPVISFKRTELKAVCFDFAVTYQVCGEVEQISDYTFYGLAGLEEFWYKNATHLDNQGFVTYTLAANKNYSIFFEVFTSAGAMNVSHDTFTTYDVQRLAVGEEGGGVRVTGEFLRDSRAAGCLVVLQGPPSSPDIFRALLRTQAQDTVTSSISAPPSTYTVYGYDLEEDGLPNTRPAVLLDSQMYLSSTISVEVKGSQLLRTGNISLSGSSVVIDCEFAETSPQASCVLVYREYGSPLLTVADLPQLLNFPVSITVASPENYTFAVFGKNPVTGMEEQPIVVVRFNKTVINQTLRDVKVETESEGEETNNSQTQAITIAVAGTVLVCALTCSSVLLVFIIVRQHRRKRATVKARNVEYDEVVLPPTTSSSAIPTEPNTAYATTTMSPIPTSHNVTHSSNT